MKISNLHKSFGRYHVLKGIDLSFPPGKITAILGPNGSGKTTLLKCILGIVLPDQGEIFVDGENISGKWAFRNRIGYLPQIARFPENLKVRELIRMVRDLRESSHDESRLLNFFGLNPFLNRPLKYLSGGTRQKINLLLAFMFDCRYYILDEPTAGLDPFYLIRFKELVNEEKKKGKTILLTTHIINLAEELADEIIFILDGKIYFEKSKEEIRAMTGHFSLETTIAKLLSEANYV